MSIWTILACFFLFGLPIPILFVVFSHTSFFKLSHERSMILILSICLLIMLVGNYREYAWLALIGTVYGLFECWRDLRQVEAAERQRQQEEEKASKVVDF